MTQHLSNSFRYFHAPMLVMILAFTLTTAPHAFASAPTDLSHALSMSSHLMPKGTYQLRPQVVTWNIKGGDGDATQRFNPDVTDRYGSATVQTRMAARWPYVYSIVLQEVCEQNWADIVLKLATDGLTAGPNGYRFHPYQNMGPAVPNSEDVFDGCGSWAGNGIIIRGNAVGSFATPFTAQGISGVTSHLLCVWNTAVTCNAHMGPANQPGTAGTQSNQYRQLATFFGAATGLPVHAGGDFNLPPNAWSQVAWAFNGFQDADDHDGHFQSTMDSGLTFDYIFRGNPRNWAADAYISSSGHSDHHWKQGYYA